MQRRVQADLQDEAYRLATRITQLDREKRMTLMRRLSQQGVESSTLPIVRFPRNERMPLSYAQNGLWLTWRMTPHSAAYNMGGTLILIGDLDSQALSAAVDDLARRHETLRTVFQSVADGEPWQEVVAPKAGILQVEDLSTIPATEREARAHARTRQHAEQPFDLETGPIWRVLLLRLEATTHWLSIVTHHIAADGWSVSVLIEDLAESYEAHVAGTVPATLPSLPIQFADYAIWQREWGDAGELDRQLDYWKRRLGSEHPLLPLPLDRPRPAVRSDAGARYRFLLAGQLAAAVRRLAETNGSSVFMVILALLKLILARHCGVHDIRVGVPVANRGRAETHRLVGYLTNVLVIRTRVDLQSSFVALLRTVREGLLEAQSNAECPFDLLVSTLTKERVAGSNPLFQVKCTEQPDAAGLRDFGGLRVSTDRAGDIYARFDLSLDFTIRPDAIACDFVYPTDIFDASTVARMAAALVSVARQVAVAPEASLIGLLPTDDLSLMCGEELQCDVEDDVVACWERCVVLAPQAPALQQDERVVTRSELDAMANSLASRLVELGVGPEIRVGVHAPRAIELVVGLLAVLKAGGVYVPLDPALPQERLTYQIRDSGIVLLLSTDTLAWRPEVPVVSLTEIAADSRSIYRRRSLSPAQAAYIIYTSGSTGRPKGVVVSRGALANYVIGVLARLDLPESVASMAMVSTAAADLGHTVLFGSLCSGRLLHLISAERAIDSDRFAEYMHRHRVDVLKIVPSHLHALLNTNDFRDMPPWHTLVLGGEPTHWALLDRIASVLPDTRVFNHYGPTETTVGILMQEARGATRDTATLPVGKPLPNTRACVLGSELQPVPAGTIGELYLGGINVARGYQDRPAQTSERFVADPFGSGERLYRSGDRVRQLADGGFEFLGRADDQVKIRGYRVELGEIAQALLAQAEVDEAIAVSRRGNGLNAVVYGYVTAKAGSDIDGAMLSERLHQSLPDYMVPSAIVVLPSFPRNANGKIDRQALPEPQTADEGMHQAPQGDLESTLAAIWADVLGAEHIGRHDNFFVLGGDSILALKVVARAHKLGLMLAPRAVFKHQKLHELAASVATESSAAEIVVPVQRSAPLPLSHAQARQWFLWQLDKHSTAYHVSGALKLLGRLDTEALKMSFDALVSRHESLRTLFRAREDGRIEQIILADGRAHIELIDSSEEQVDAEVTRLRRTPFDLTAGPLFRIGLIRLPAGEHVLVVVMHHIVSDGWSMQIIVDEFVELYRAKVEGREPELRTLPIQYADYAVWQRNWLEAGERKRQLEYWRAQLRDEHPVLQLSTDRPRPAEPKYRAARHSFDLPAALAEALHRRAHEHRATLFMVLLAGLQALLHRYTGQPDVRVGATNANRNRPETQGVVGFFVNTQVLKSRIDGWMTSSALLDRVRSTVMEAQEHQDLPFEQLVEALQPERDRSHQPLFQVLLDHQRKDYGQLKRLPELTLQDYGTGEQGALFELWMNTVEHADGRVSVRVSYAAELFEAETIRRLGKHYQCVLQAIADRPEQCIGEIDILDEAERQQLHRWEMDVRHYAGVEFIHRLIGRQAQRNPSATALSFGGEQVSYGELNVRANRLAHRLIASGVSAEARVGLAMERSVEMVVGLLAILKAGGAYVPLDPQYPAERLSYLMRDSGIGLLLTQTSVVERLPSVEGITSLALDALDLSGEPEHDPIVSVHPDNLAYVIYTSGSTGQPKGAQLSHRNVNRLLAATHEWFQFNDRDVWTLFHSYAFDFSVWELFGALCHGGRLVIVPYEVSRSPEEFLTLLRREEVTVLNQTPSAFKQLLQVPALYTCDDLALRAVIFGGEALEPQSLRPWLEHFGELKPRLINMYGITETTVHVTYRPITKQDLDAPRSPIGERIPDLGLRVLDGELNAVPVGVPGELYVAGDGLARGYLNRASLSSERFIADPSSTRGERLYRTGDQVRWNKEGQLEYLGRIDQQVKIRGFRIELGEIEAQLLNQPEVREAVVIAQAHEGDQRLLAYLVPDTDFLNESTQNTEGSSREALVTQWASVFDSTYESEGIAPSFRGWNSSYTDQPIPEVEMQEWLQSTVDRIRALKPERILEIGCGVGLLVQHLAPIATTYVGTDLSARAVQDLQAWIRTQPALSHVQLQQAEARDFTNIPAGEFDTVVLNSVAQYLPDVDYLLDVLTGAVQLLGPQGRLFIGDLRHLAHIPMFHASVQLSKASAQLSVRQLKSRIQRAIWQDKELVLEPALFHALAAHLKMGSVQIQLKRGRFENELTHYRYDVVMHRRVIEAPAAEMFDGSGPDAFARLSTHLATQHPDALTMQAMPNRRLARDRAAWHLLQSSDERTTVGEVLAQLEKQTSAGLDPEALWAPGERHGYQVQIDPEALWALGEQHGYQVQISWTPDSVEGTFDAQFVKVAALTVHHRAPQPSEPLPTHWRTWASDPVRALFWQQLGSVLRERLSITLPDHMVPSHFMTLDKLPLTANGKLDRKALPEPEFIHAGTYEAPRGAAEEALAEIWSDVLGVERIGRNDNFFELGGHSLLAVRIVSRARRRFNRDLSLRSVFEHPTLQEQARLLDGQLRTPSPVLIFHAADSIDRPPLSYAQQRLWFLWRLDPRSASMNSSAILRLTGRLDLDAWRFACQFLVARHRVLRTVFREEDGQVWQQVLEESALPCVPVVDLSAMDQDARLHEQVAAEVREPFDLARGPLLRIRLFPLAEDSHVMCVVMHHIVTDGWSINVLIRDFAAAYAARRRGEAPSLPALNVQYVDFAIGQREWLKQGEMQRQLDFWMARLAGIAPLALPADTLPPSRRSYPCGVMRASLGEETTAALRTFSESSAVTPFMAMLAAVAVVMAERSGQQRFLVGTDFANRNHPETEALVGFFVNQIALPVDCVEPRSLRELLLQVKNTVLDAADHQDLPFDRLVERLRDHRRTDGRAPLFQIKVLYQDDTTASVHLPELRVDDYPIEPTQIELDLILMFRADAENIHLICKYDRELFHAQTLECIGEEIAAAVKIMLAQPDISLSELRAHAARVRYDFQARQAQGRIEILAQWRAGLRSRSAT